jgi:surface antigen
MPGLSTRHVAILPTIKATVAGNQTNMNGLCGMANRKREKVMHRSALAAAIVASLQLAGCANNEQGGTAIGAIAGGLVGNQFGKGSGKVATTLAGAVVGGIVGNDIGRSLDARDRELARRAEYEAWESGPPREPVRWRNPDNGRYGEIMVEDYYYRGPSRCRDFVHRVWIDGRPQQMRGTACRNPDGTWTQVA